MIMDVLPRTLAGIAHNKSVNDHPLPIQAWHKSVRSIVGDGEPIVARRVAVQPGDLVQIVVGGIGTLESPVI